VRRAAIAVAASVLVSALAGAEPATTVREVALRQKPAADAKAVATVPPNTAVELVKRQGAWVQLEAAGGSGWAKLFDVKLGTAGAQPAKTGDDANAIADTLNLATGRREASVATGVRGLDEKMLRKAQPDEREYAELGTYAATPTSAQAFAKAGKLAPRKVAPIGAGAPQAAGKP
jgi:hypothetical protein